MSKGKHLKGSEKSIYQVYDYFDCQSKKQKTTSPPELCKKMAEATGYTERTISRILKEKRNLDRDVFSSLAKGKKNALGCSGICRRVSVVPGNPLRNSQFCVLHKIVTSVDSWMLVHIDPSWLEHLIM